MKNAIRFSLLALFFVLLGSKAEAQKFRDSTMVVIETTDGNTFFGKILSQNDQEFRLETETVGIVSIPKLRIKSIKKAEKDRIKNGEYWHENNQSSRHFFSPSGYGLRKGEGYYQNTWVFINQVNVGLTDHISLGGGIIPTFIFYFGRGRTCRSGLPRNSVFRTKTGAAALARACFM